ncbi:MAG TPA: CDP-alcohol phosphatidyltransferase family protein, partial [Deferrimonas sp.]
MNFRSGLLNLPNLLTLGRIAAIPLLVFFLFFDSPLASFWAAIIFSVAAITDWLDGWLARK